MHLLFYSSFFSESEQMTYLLIFGFAVICSHLQPLAQAATCSHLSLKQVSFNTVL